MNALTEANKIVSRIQELRSNSGSRGERIYCVIWAPRDDWTICRKYDTDDIKYAQEAWRWLGTYIADDVTVSQICNDVAEFLEQCGESI